MQVLFVCTGNICRSPTAERLAVAQAETRQVVDFTVGSAGTRAVIGNPMHPMAATVLGSLGADPTRFAARQLTSRIVRDSSLIFTMERSHRDSVLELAPAKLRSTFTLREVHRIISEFSPQSIADLADLRGYVDSQLDLDIRDPIGGGQEVFELVGAQISELIPLVIDFCAHAATSS